MIELRDVQKRFGDTWALQHIDFEVAEGEVVGVVGPNGAGKTSCLQLIAGVLQPDGGMVRVGGVCASRSPIAHRGRVGYLAESVPLYPELRVDELLRYRAELKGVPRRQRKAELARVAGLCDIEDVRRRIVGQLSKGYRQRVGLAEALLGAPPVLVLDEPTSGLDPNQLRQVRGIVNRLRGQHTVVIASHLLAEVEASCDRVLLMDKGTLLAAGTVHELCARHAVVSFQMHGEFSQLKHGLEAIAGVRELQVVAANEDFHQVEVLVHPEIDLAGVAESVASVVCAEGGRLSQLQVGAQNLSEVFKRLTDGGEP